MEIVNLCPHPIRIRRNIKNKAAEPDEMDVVVPPHLGADGKSAPARVQFNQGWLVMEVNGIRIFSRGSFGEVEGLPEPQDDTLFLVSVVVAGRPEVARRDDIFVPGTGPSDEAVRKDGQIYAVTRLVRS